MSWCHCKKNMEDNTVKFPRLINGVTVYLTNKEHSKDKPNPEINCPMCLNGEH